MKIEVKDLKINDIFTECGITVKVSKITRKDLENGKEAYLILAPAIKHNVKLYGKKNNFGVCCYHKKATTKISVKR